MVVVGASGAGKDTLIRYVAAALDGDERFKFVKRVITRAPGGNEENECVDKRTFESLVSKGAFALHWEAHGLLYGLPAIVDRWLEDGCVVVANGSRGILRAARNRFPSLVVINITARADVIAGRLVARGREDAAAIAARMVRTVEQIDGRYILEIDNSGSIESAGTAMTAHLLEIADRREKLEAK